MTNLKWQMANRKYLGDRERQLAIETDTQDRSRLEFNVLAFGHQDAARHAGSRRAGDRGNSAAHNDSGQCPEPAAHTCIPGRPLAGTTSANLALIIFRAIFLVAGVIVDRS